MNIIKKIIADYEKLIKTNIQNPLSNGDTIKFVFNPQDLPHLLGLQHLVDNPDLFEYSEKRLSATDLRQIVRFDNTKIKNIKLLLPKVCKIIYNEHTFLKCLKISIG